MHMSNKDEDLLDPIKQLVSIPSTADNRTALREAYNFMAEFVRANAPSVVIEEFESNGTPSFLAYRAGQRPGRFHVLLNGHVDVVHGDAAMFKPYTENGKFYGRGTHDMKAACIVLAKVFCEYVDKVPYALGLQIVCDEETGGFDGTLHQIQQGVRSDFVVTGESGRTLSSHEIANEAKGIVVADVVLNGRSSHSAYPWRGDNAATKATRFVHLLHSRFPETLEESNSTTFTVTSISAESASLSRTPNTAIVRLDIRYTPGDPNFRSKDHFKALIQEIYPGAEVKPPLVYSAC